MKKGKEEKSMRGSRLGCSTCMFSGECSGVHLKASIVEHIVLGGDLHKLVNFASALDKMGIKLMDFEGAV